MNLAELRAGLVANGVTLTLTPEGKIKPRADKTPSLELIAAMKEQRNALIRQLQEGRGVDGRFLPDAPQHIPGHCGCCALFHLAPEWGTWMGTCTAPSTSFPAGETFIAIHAAHRCCAVPGRGWTPKGEVREN